MKNIKRFFLLPLFLLINILIFAEETEIKTGIYKFTYYRPFSDEKSIILQEYKDGKKDGLFKKQNFAGETMIKAYYKDDKLDGVAEVYWDNGKVMARTEYKNGEKNGVSELFGKNGTLLVKEHYINGLCQGIKENFRDDGTLYSTIEYKDGKQNGKIKYYYENGKLLGEGTIGDKTYPEEEGQKKYTEIMIGVWKGYYPDGKLKKEVKFSDTKFEADVKTYFPNGKISSQGKLKNSRFTIFDSSWEKSGIWKYYYENGNLKYEKNITDDEKIATLHGQVAYLIGYYPDGKLQYKREENPNGDDFRFKLITYYKNGNIKTIEYVDWASNDHPIEGYYPNGQLQFKYFPYKKDIFYTPDGKLINENESN